MKYFCDVEMWDDELRKVTIKTVTYEADSYQEALLRSWEHGKPVCTPEVINGVTK